MTNEILDPFCVSVRFVCGCVKDAFGVCGGCGSPPSSRMYFSLASGGRQKKKGRKKKKEKIIMSGRDVPDCPPGRFQAPKFTGARAQALQVLLFGRQELQADKPNSLPKLVSLLATPPAELPGFAFDQ